MSDSTALPELPTFSPDAQVCGNCKLWSAHSVDTRGWVGPCRLQPQRGLFPPTAPICNVFVARGAASTAAVAKSEAKERTARSVAPVVKRANGTIEVPPQAPARAAVFSRPAPTTAGIDPNQLVDLDGLNMTRAELMQLFREASGEGEAPPMAAKWEGGVLQMVPAKAELQAKEVPIDTFFHKIVMVRDRLRTLEQKLNAHPKLTDAEKVEMQHYITRVYGSLTTFNALFRDRDDQFIGAKGDE